ncbi:MAG: T9SS type A sorting domain-containing protein [Chitinophagales bacterium]
MIKQLLILFTISFFSIGVFAQEKLMPLSSNKAYPSDSPEKGFRFDYDFVCNPEQQVRLEVTSITQPDCGADDRGSVTLEVINGPNGAYTFTYTTANNISQTETANTNNITLSNLMAGPYVFTVSSEALADDLELWYGLDNLDTQPIPAIRGNFVKRDVFCDEPGSIGFSFDITDRELPIFRFQDDFKMGTLSSENLRVDLPPTMYYFRDTTSKSNCHAYQIFEIGREATIDSLTFTEDCSTSLLYPDLAAWEDDFVFVNQTMAYLPLSIGVATFDGFNQFGQPYEPISEDDEVGLIDGDADVLTSRPVCYNIMDEFGNLQPVVENDDGTMFLRFFYQPQGIGDFPNSKDSLKLAFWGDDGTWHQIWRLQGPTKNEPEYPFNPVSVRLERLSTGTAIEIETHISIRDNIEDAYRDSSYVKRDTIPDVNFVFDGFQFRFNNKATISGFNDHWHLDYIQFNEDSLGSLDDITPLSSIPSLLNDYQAMPWRHFTNNIETSLKNEIFVPLRNNSNGQGLGLGANLSISDVCTKQVLYLSSVVAQLEASVIALESNSNANDFIDINTQIIDSLDSGTFDRDSVVFELKYQLSGENDDTNQDNNTLYQYQNFFNYYAYDDGTAEVAYGLEGAESQLAMEFNVLEDDVLQAIQLNFVNMNSNDDKNAVYLMVWDSIGVGSNKSNLIYSEEIAINPQYVSQRNGFYTIVLENPLSLSAGRYYIGFEQEFKNQINLGFDRNHDASTKTFFNSASIWTPSIIEGAVMLRPVFGESLNGTNLNVGIEDENGLVTKVVLYPNPANDRIYFKVEGNQALQLVRIFDFSGRMIVEEYLQNGGLDVRELPQGLYLVKTYGADLQEMSSHKLMVNN